MSKLYYQRWYIQAGFERLFGTGADGAGGVASLVVLDLAHKSQRGASKINS